MREVMTVLVLASLAACLLSAAVAFCCLAARILGFGPANRIATYQMKRAADAETARGERAAAGRVSLQ
jgi:hypothetical protein